jgi:hypothetical protein
MTMLSLLGYISVLRSPGASVMGTVSFNEAVLILLILVFTFTWMGVLVFLFRRAWRSRRSR